MQNIEQKKYDIIVIGSGIGGLAFASIMSQLYGKRVLVLERHFKLGGYTHTFERKGYRWDVGVHYVGKMARNEESRQLFDLITQGGVLWNKMPEQFDEFNYPDFDFAVHSDPNVYRADLIERFPSEAASIREYFSDIKRVQQWFRLRVLQSMVPGAVRWLMASVSKSDTSLATQLTQHYLDAKFKSAELKALLASQWGDCGLPPSRSAFSMHALVVGHFFGGGYYPVGSAKSIAESIAPIIRAHGGECLVNHTVKEIIVQRGEAIGVRVLANRGKTEEEVIFNAPIIVSDAGRAITFGELVPEEFQEQLPAAVSDKICSMITLYVALKSSPASAGFHGENHWIFESYDHDNMYSNSLSSGGSPGGCFLSFPSLKDPRATKHTAEIIAFMKIHDFAVWQKTKWKHRGDSYEAFKTELSEKLIALVEKKYPGFSDLIDFAELSTPLTVESFTGHVDGAIYGYPATVKDFNSRKFRPETSIKNLFLTGADLVSPGIMGALTGGVITASNLTGGLAGYLKIMNAAASTSKKLADRSPLRNANVQSNEVEKELIHR